MTADRRGPEHRSTHSNGQSRRCSSPRCLCCRPCRSPGSHRRSRRSVAGHDVHGERRRGGRGPGRHRHSVGAAAGEDACGDRAASSPNPHPARRSTRTDRHWSEGCSFQLLHRARPPTPELDTVIVNPIGLPTFTLAASAVFRMWIPVGPVDDHVTLRRPHPSGRLVVGRRRSRRSSSRCRPRRGELFEVA